MTLSDWFVRSEAAPSRSFSGLFGEGWEHFLYGRSATLALQRAHKVGVQNEVSTVVDSNIDESAAHEQYGADCAKSTEKERPLRVVRHC